MLEERAKVLSVEGHSIWVTADRRQGCAKCEAGEGCGGGMLTRLVKRKVARVEVVNELDGLRPGDDVVIGFDEKALLKSSFMAYLLPIVAMFAAALFADLILDADDLIVAAVGMLGLGAGFLLLSRFSAATLTDPRYRPIVLRRTSGLTSGCQIYITDTQD